MQLGAIDPDYPVGFFLLIFLDFYRIMLEWGFHSVISILLFSVLL
jgi:hypothetical protein